MSDMYTKQQNLDMSEQCVPKTDISIHEPWDTLDMAHRPNGLTVDVTDLIKRAIAEEREACAKLCDKSTYWDGHVAANCAAAIRGRTE
jgi:hypothetical protein